MNWIKVSDRLPEKGQIVLIYLPDVVRIGYEFDGRWYFYHNLGENDPMVIPDVICWMPLPQPPEFS